MSPAQQPRPPARAAAAGFTLIEILVAMAVLLLGMTGILAIFTTALELEQQAAERLDVALSLSAVTARIREDLAERGREGGDAARFLDGETFPVPGIPHHRYRVRLEPIPDDPTQRGHLCRIEIITRARGAERIYDLGYRPVVPEPDNDARIRELLKTEDRRGPP